MTSCTVSKFLFMPLLAPAHTSCTIKAYPAAVQLQKEAAGRRLASFYRLFNESVDTGDIHKRVLHLQSALVVTISLQPVSKNKCEMLLAALSHKMNGCSKRSHVV